MKATSAVVRAPLTGAAPEGPELDGPEKPEEHVGQEPRRAGQELPGELDREPAADGRVRIGAGGRPERRRRNASPVKEGAAAAGDHVERFPERAPLVVVEVAAQIEHAVPLEREVTRGQHALSRRVPLTEGQGRIRRQEHQTIGGPFRPTLDEERPLPEV